MKIRDIITEAEERDLDKDLEQYFKRQEEKKQRAEKFKKFADRPGILSQIAKGVQKGNRIYNKLKPIVTAKIPGA